MSMIDIHSLTNISQRLSINELLDTNKVSAPFGLVLSPQDALELIKGRDTVIQNYGRVELGLTVVNNIISEFCSSPFINAHDYAATLNELIDLFYYMKNEIEDKIGDKELISLMSFYFNNSCRGSLELLKNRELALTARILKKYWEYARGDD